MSVASILRSGSQSSLRWMQGNSFDKSGLNNSLTSRSALATALSQSASTDKAAKSTANVQGALKSLRNSLAEVQAAGKSPAVPQFVPIFASTPIFGFEDITAMRDVTEMRDVLATRDVYSTRAVYEQRDITEEQDVFETRDVYRTRDITEERDVFATRDVYSTRDITEEQAVYEQRAIRETIATGTRDLRSYASISAAGIDVNADFSIKVGANAAAVVKFTADNTIKVTANGTSQAFTFNASGGGFRQGLADALNSISGVSASYSSDGKLSIKAANAADLTIADVNNSFLDFSRSPLSALGLTAGTKSAEVTGYENVQVGTQTVVVGQESYVSGQETVKTGTETVVIGQESYISGQETVKSGTRSVVVGQEHVQVGEEQYVSGTEEYVSSQESVVVGQERYVIGQRQFVIGEREDIVGFETMAEPEANGGANSDPVRDSITNLMRAISALRPEHSSGPFNPLAPPAAQNFDAHSALTVAAMMGSLHQHSRAQSAGNEADTRRALRQLETGLATMGLLDAQKQASGQIALMFEKQPAIEAYARAGDIDADKPGATKLGARVTRIWGGE